MIAKDKSRSHEICLKTMSDFMSNGSTYQNGSYVNGDLGLYLGWVYPLGSPSDSIPIVNETKDIILLVTGEVFPEKDMVLKLKSSGHVFDTSDASFLVHLYEDEGFDFVKGMNGWFSGILVDLRCGEVCLFNDRYRMQRVYFHENKDTFYFSSDAKTLLKILPDLRSFDPISLGQYLACGSTLENRSLFSGISLLPAASSWKFPPGRRVEKATYFLVREWEEQRGLGEQDLFERLVDVLQRIVPKYFSPTDKVAMSLTGGIDTRIVMSFMEEKNVAIPCYTFGGIYRECLDVQIARKIAEACHQEHTVIPITDAFLARFGEYAAETVYLTDGVMDISGAHEIYLNNIARDISPIRMTGLFGSEILRSVDYISPDLFEYNFLDSEVESSIRDAWATFKMSKTGNPYSYVVFKMVPWYLQGRLLAAQSQLTVRTPFMDNDLVKLMYQASETMRKGKGICLRLICRKSKELGRIKTDRGIRPDGPEFLSLAARAYYEFLFKAEYYLGNGMPHWLSDFERRIAFWAPHKLIVGRHKIEQYRIWFSGSLSEYVKSVLFENASMNRSYLRRGTIERIVNGHNSGTHNFSKEITKFLTLELIQRNLLEKD